MSRLPTPGSDSGSWGTILNDFLGVSHTADGKIALDSWANAGARPVSPASGQIGINLGTSNLERYNGTSWDIVSPGDALTTSPLSQFSATTSAQLRGVLSDETGTGSAVFQGGNIGAATATTAAPGTNTTQVATTAFVLANGGSVTLPFIMASANGIAPGNSASVNKVALQALIDANTVVGARIYFTEPVPMAGGILLKSNIKLEGNNYSALKGSLPVGDATPSTTATPSGAAFLITDTVNVFIKVYTNTSIDGIIFHYPSQAYTATSSGSLITYPVTIQKQTGTIQSCSFTRLLFTGNTQCFDFTSDVCQDLIFDQIYAYPLGGRFIAITNCYDIPRITRCHINPGAGINFLGGGIAYTTQILDYVAANGQPSFDLDAVDEFMMSECFVFANRTAFNINNCYGTMVNCNADMVETGAHITLTSIQKYVSLVSFSCVPGGGTLGNRNAVIFDGTGGKLFATNLHSFVGVNGVVPSSSSPGANALIKVSGSGAQRVSLIGARTSSISGVFAKFIDQTNGSAVINYAESDQQSVTTTSNAGQLSGVVLTNPTFNGFTAANVGADTPTKTLIINVDGADYKIFAKPLVSVAAWDGTAFTDHATDTNGVLPTAHTPDVGIPWSSMYGTMSIQSNRYQTGSATGAYLDMGASDGTFTVVARSGNGDNVRLGFRTNWAAQVNNIGGSAVLYLLHNGNPFLGPTSVSFSSNADHTIQAVLAGTSIIIKIDGSAIFTTTSALDQTGTTASFGADQSGSIFDDFTFVP